MKSCVFLIVIYSSILFAQAEFVDVSNRVYEFLDRMNYLNLLENYNSFQIPKTRKEISNYIKNLIDCQDKLDKADREFLEYLKIEFEYDLRGTLNHSSSLISSSDYNLFSDTKKYFYFFSDKSKMNLFVNLIAEGELIFNKTSLNNSLSSANLFNAGGEMRGTILDKVGFYLRGTNGVVSGNREAALTKQELKYNFKFNEKLEERFYDETHAYISADFDLIKLKLARDRVNIGYGTEKFLLGNYSPLFDYFGLNLNYDFFSFDYLHAKLLGKTTYIVDTVSGDYFSMQEKYFAYHRLGFNVQPFFNVGVGEVVVYGDRALDLSYLVPFSFFKSIEHSNRDRDNTMLFIDFSSNVIPNSKFFFTFLIDDINFGKIGTGWWGNQTLFNAGIYTSPFYGFYPLELKFEYLRLEPYTYTHRLNRNSFTQFGYNLSSFIQPNSELFLFGINYRFTDRLSLSMEFSYTNHGANILKEDGTIINVGGDINLGHRKFDSEVVKFLNGDLQIDRSVRAKFYYEPFNQLSFFLNFMYHNRSTNQKLAAEEIQLYCGTSIKF